MAVGGTAADAQAGANTAVGSPVGAGGSVGVGRLAGSPTGGIATPQANTPTAASGTQHGMATPTRPSNPVGIQAAITRMGSRVDDPSVISRELEWQPMLGNHKDKIIDFPCRTSLDKPVKSDRPIAY